MPDLETQGIAALSTSGEIFLEKSCKINITFQTSVSILGVLNLILEKASQRIYL